jgi:hypothetical protein
MSQWPIYLNNGNSLIFEGHQYDAVRGLRFDEEGDIHLAIRLELLVLTPANVLEWEKHKAEQKLAKR